jgi:glycosyltransferase involved in cell wall biosynthesis
LSKMPAEVAQYFRVVQHGVDHFKYWGGNMTQNRARRVVYSSSPDRGLDRLKKIQPQIEALGYELYITPYGGTSSLTDEALSKVLQTSQFWVHPGGGVELFCIAAVEAQVAGCTPIVVPNGGLHETVKHGYRFTDASFEEGLLAVLAGEAFMQGVNANHIPSWSLATKSLLNVGEL